MTGREIQFAIDMPPENQRHNLLHEFSKTLFEPQLEKAITPHNRENIETD